jgi:LytS/YehU family sensor histidine kinase
MILLTLVENAIKHGIEPALRGGEVAVSAQALDGAVRIRVQDGGVGMSTFPEPDERRRHGPGECAPPPAPGLRRGRRRWICATASRA